MSEAASDILKPVVLSTEPVNEMPCTQCGAAILALESLSPLCEVCAFVAESKADLAKGELRKWIKHGDIDSARTKLTAMSIGDSFRTATNILIIRARRDRWRLHFPGNRFQSGLLTLEDVAAHVS